jgi:hypothetical protein
MTGTRNRSPDAARAAQARSQAAHRVALESEALRAMGITSQAALARALTEREVPAPQGSRTWTHTTVARVLARAV